MENLTNIIVPSFSLKQYYIIYIVHICGYFLYKQSFFSLEKRLMSSFFSQSNPPTSPHISLSLSLSLSLSQSRQHQERTKQELMNFNKNYIRNLLYIVWLCLMWRIMLAKWLGAVALISGNESRYTAASLTLNFEIIKSKNWKLIWLMYMYHNGPSSQYC